MLIIALVAVILLYLRLAIVNIAATAVITRDITITAVTTMATVGDQALL